jgi:hypothetical protein
MGCIGHEDSCHWGKLYRIGWDAFGHEDFLASGMLQWHLECFDGICKQISGWWALLSVGFIASSIFGGLGF